MIRYSQRTPVVVSGLALALALAGCDSGGTLSKDITDKLQAVLDQAAVNEQAPGLVMAVQIGDADPWFGVTGYQDEGKTIPMAADAQFRMGSITKNFVGMAILEQVQEGKLSLDDTLEKWLPGVISNIDGNQITIHQLLNHTSGIESYTEEQEWIITMIQDPLHVWNAPTDLLAYTQELRAKSIAAGTVIAPGSKFAYSNTNFILLGMIAAKVDGASNNDWAQVVEKRFFQRLAMTHTRIPPTGDVELGGSNNGYVNFYNFTQGECTVLDPPCQNADEKYTLQEMSNAWSAGAIISNAPDLLKWANAEVKGSLLTEEMRQKQQDFIDTCTTELQVGLAMFRQTKYGLIGHRGEIFGFNATFQYLAEKDMTVVVMANRTALDNKHVGPVPEDVVAALYPDIEPQPWVKPPQCSSSH
ncbi:serine hydrolase domain-containing protein [Hyalangium versicolor]|uniref:serine hydrolase domain-containing protein n=1 Tax=Hyalangium versicolor TaxID=2861190 RepID=UPI001CCF1239|nr:serine hydrolase domain-containing protein [Hyalangium versicolor]